MAVELPSWLFGGAVSRIAPVIIAVPFLLQALRPKMITAGGLANHSTATATVRAQHARHR